MNLVSSVVLFAVFTLIYAIITEVFTVLFQLTGVTRDKAQTQVISMLTNSGFTTSESEIIMTSKRRRTLARTTMLCGYSFSVIIVSLLVNFFLNISQAELKHILISLIVAGTFSGIYILLVRRKKIPRQFDVLIEKLGNRLIFGKHSNVLILVDMVREKAIVEVTLDHLPDCLNGIKLAESPLKLQYHIQILYIKRKEVILPVVTGETVVQPGDTLLLFGDYKAMRAVFERPEHPAHAVQA